MTWRRSIVFAGVFGALLVASASRATMPVLTEMPKIRTQTSCRSWANKQIKNDGDIPSMWGLMENGESSAGKAGDRLTDYCLGKKPPEIVGFWSSVGVANSYCRKHPNFSLCIEAGNFKNLLTNHKEVQCYERVYSDDHLSSHPNQMTKSMKIKFAAKEDLKDGFEFIAEVGVRGSDKKHTTGGICLIGSDSTIKCSVDCDGGGFTVSQKQKSQAVRVLLDHFDFLGCSQEPVFSLKSGKDDKEFILHSAPISACASMKIFP